MKPVSKKLFTASTGSRCIGSIVGWRVCFISCYGPFFHIWLLAMSQRQWSEASTPRHNNLSGKNISLMLQSYIVWDDSESERGLLFGCLCSVAALLRNGGGFPPAWVFLDLCVNSRELCTGRAVWGSEGATPMHVCGNPVVSSRHVIKKKNGCAWRHGGLHFSCTIIVVLYQSGWKCSAEVKLRWFRQTFDVTFNWNFTVSLAAASGLTGPDWAESRQLEAALVWTLVGRWSVSRGLPWGHLRVPDLPG